MMGGVVRVSVQRWMKSALLKEARYSKYANVKRILDKHHSTGHQKDWPLLLSA